MTFGRNRVAKPNRYILNGNLPSKTDAANTANRVAYLLPLQSVRICISERGVPRAHLRIGSTIAVRLNEKFFAQFR